jgi:acid phosphatase family membrane protein YuiD
MAANQLPIWVLVLLCSLAVQLSKVLIYSMARRKLAIDMMGESVGLPSLHAANLTCMTALLAIRLGWDATLTGLGVVFTVIAIHDAMRLKSASANQRLVLYELIQTVPGASRFQQEALDILTNRAHRPLHVAFGVLFGLLFALAVSEPPSLSGR